VYLKKDIDLLFYRFDMVGNGKILFSEVDIEIIKTFNILIFILVC